ncbi:MAG: hypothetical protein WKF77_31105 [Planctomycetaceae bacterium]
MPPAFLRSLSAIPRFLILLPLIFTTPGFAQDVILRSDHSQHWYRGNMHTHSLWSDGDDYPEMIATWYRDHGYQFLVFTDHNTLHNRERWIDIEKNKGGMKAFEKLTQTFPAEWIQTRETEGRREVRLKEFDAVYERLAKAQEYILIQGEEISDSFNRHPIHMCATNTSELLPPTGGDSIVDVMQRNIDAAVSRRERSGESTLVHLNHPNFGYAVTAEHLMQVVGENFFEVYNGHPTVHNSGDETHASTERQWDIVNTWRLAKLQLPVIYGLATDDGHDYFQTEPQKGAQPGRGWVMVLTNTLTPDALIKALEAGRFYASSGVTLEEIQQTANSIKVTVAAVPGVSYRIDFIGTHTAFDDASTPAIDDPEKVDTVTRRYSTDVGKVLKSVEGTVGSYTFAGTELYVRAVVTASRVHPNPSQVGEFERAWVQPAVIANAAEGR